MLCISLNTCLCTPVCVRACVCVCVCVCVDWTKRGVQIPLADGMDFVKEVVEYHNVSTTILYIQYILYIISLQY